MAFLHTRVTLTGAAQQLVTPAAYASEIGRCLILQPAGENDNPIYVGGPGVSSSAYAFRLEAGDASNIPPAPFMLGEAVAGVVALQEFWVLGTQNEVLHIGYLR